MRLTDQAQRAVVEARAAAQALGAELVGPQHLLLGLIVAEGGARHALGLDAEALHAAGGALFAPRPVGVPAGVAPEVKATLEDAVRRARTGGRPLVATTDVLAALLAAPDGTAARVLRAAGREPLPLEHAACCPETVTGYVGPALGELVARADAVPRGAWRLNLAAVLVLWGLLYATVLTVTRDTSGPEIVLSAAAGSIALTLLFGLPRLFGQFRRMTARSVAQVPLPPDAAVLLDRLRVRRLEVHIQAGGGTDRCLRLGRRALILLSDHTDRSAERSRFVLWHEVAHLARRDTPLRTVNALLGLGLFNGALLSFDWRAILLAVVAVPLFSVALRWWGETACDRLAVAQAGPGALHAWMSSARIFAATHRRRTRVRGWLTHPPLSLRAALHQR